MQQEGDYAKFDIKKRAMLEALVKTLGVVHQAARMAQITRMTHYNWLKSDSDYAAAVDDIQDIALDFAESKLHKQIENDDTTATIFFLKTKGKKRGYIERTETELSGQVKTIVWNEEKTYEANPQANTSP